MYRLIAELEQSSIVRQVEIINLINEPDLQVLYLRANLTDGSILYVRETLTPASDKYSYHWQTADGQLIRRWDNAPHWPSVDTHPHHCHIGRSDNVLPSDRPTISDVIQHLTEQIAK